MKNHNRKSSTFKGFTLIELIIVIVILGIIAAIGAKILQTGFENYATNQSLANVNQEVRLALERMTKDIHAINSPASISTANASQLSFVNINGTTITYQLSGTNLMYNSQILASGVNSLTFSYLNGNGVATTTLNAIRYITVALQFNQGNVNYTVRTTINTMNYAAI